MPTKRELDTFIAKRTKSAQVLEMLIANPYITIQDIIKETHTNCPHKQIETIRKNFGADFVKFRDKPFKRTQYSSKGKPYQISDTYREYFLEKIAD